MKITPTPAPVPGVATSADRTWACDYLSTLLGRSVRGGLRVEQLAHKLAQERQHATRAVPEPRAAS